jgi:subtilisin family serine protease
MPTTPNDPLFPYQWFLENTGQSGGAIGSDINVLPVWADYTGKGVRVAIVDDGVQLLHPDLVANIDLAESWDTVTNKQGGDPGPGQNHGTAVAGLVGEVANNGIGGSGVAPDATLISYRMAFGPDFTYAQPITAFTRALAADADVVNNSWGADAAFLQNAANPALAPFYAALNELGSEGRDGNGTIVVFANGNGGRGNFDSMLNNVLNSKYVVAVAAVENNGLQTQYSTPGTNLLVAAPAGRSTNQADDRPGNGVLTTDRTSIDGYNKNAGVEGDYAYNFNGTSAASPVVSGVVALILDANPDLGYRDVQEILAHSARFVDQGGTAWTTTGADGWNGGGALFSRLYGFGEVDAHGAVRLAEIYPFLHDAPRNDSNAAHATTTYTGGPVDYGPGGAGVLKFTLPEGIQINHLDLSVTAAIPDVDRTAMVLISPSGTTMTLFNQPPNAALRPWPGTFALGTNAFWGEESAGEWTLLAATSKLGQGGTISGVTLDVYGNAPSTEKEFVYTDDFASTVTVDSWKGAGDDRLGLGVRPDETAIINAVAVSSDVTVDLAARTAVITGETIGIAAGTRVTKIFTGDGDDRLVGDAGANLLFAGRGTNTIDGGAGTDTVLFLGSRADYTATYNASGLFVAAAREGGTHDSATHVEKAQFTEGTGYLPAMSDTGLDIVALYSGLMTRDPDAGGYRYWTLEAAQGVGASSIGASFLLSTEFTNGGGKLQNAAFIEQTYQQLLDRSVDAGGLAYWDAALTSGALTRSGLVLSIAHSEEYGTNQLGHVFGVLDALGNLWG